MMKQGSNVSSDNRIDVVKTFRLWWPREWSAACSGIGWGEYVGWSLLVCLSYLSLAVIGSMMKVTDFASPVYLVWPPTGLTFFLFYHRGVRYLPSVLLAAVLWLLVEGFHQGGVFLWSFASHVLILFFLAELFRHCFRFNPAMERIRDVALFIGCGVIGGGLLLAVAALASESISRGLDLYATVSLVPVWWIREGMGMLVVASFLLVWISNSRVNWSDSQIAEVLLWLLVLIGLGWLIFFHWAPADTLKYPLDMAMFPVMTWAAVRFGQRGATAGAIILALLGLCELVQVLGPEEKYISQGPFFLWMYVGVMGGTGMILASVVSEMRLKEEVANRNQAHLRAFIQALPDMAYVIDSNGVFEDVYVPQNHTAWEDASIYDYEGKTVDEVFEPDLAAQFYTLSEEIFATQEPRRFEYSIDKGGQRYWFEGRLAPAVNDGHATIVWVAYEISERKQAERALQDAVAAADKANLAKSEFLAMMSHEIRTPMNALLGYTDLLAYTALSEQQQEHISIIQRSGKGLLELINNILDFSKIESQRIELEELPFDIELIVIEVLEMVGVIAREKGIRLDYSIEMQGVEAVIGDAYRLRQVLINLVNNAVKFTAKGEVVLSVKEEAAEQGRRRVRFSVRDTGIGIPEEKMNQLFQAFTQVDSSTTRNYGGTGLGLVICQRLVSKMGGEIQVRSTPEEGSEFSFSLSFASATNSNQVSVEKEQVILSNDFGQQYPLSILLAEDDRTAQRFMTQLLDTIGYRVEVCSNGLEAWNALQENSYDVVLADIQMPEMSGIELAKKVRKEWVSPPELIAITAYAWSHERQEILKSGFSEVIDKPVDMSKLASSLRRAYQKRYQSDS